VKVLHLIQALMLYCESSITTMQSYATSACGTHGSASAGIGVGSDSCDRLCSLVLRKPGYRSRDPGSIPGATRFSEK
jgi:hypothetical protein